MSEHCDNCSPEFFECWEDESKCRKRPANGCPASPCSVPTDLGIHNPVTVDMGKLSALIITANAVSRKSTPERIEHLKKIAKILYHQAQNAKIDGPRSGSVQ